MNILRPGDNELVLADYSDLLEKILQALRNQNPFAVKDSNRLRIDFDIIANDVIALHPENPLGTSANSARAATVNFSPGFENRFPSQIRQIRDRLQQQLESKLGPNASIRDFVANLITDLDYFKNNAPRLDFTYPFDGYPNLQKQRLQMRQGESGQQQNPSLKFHKLTITVQNIDQFDTQVREGLENHINVQFGSASERERQELSYILEDMVDAEDSDLDKLRRIVDTETLGKLKRQAQIHYLEFLRDNINPESTTNAEGVIYLQDLIDRLNLINYYIHKVEYDDGDYLVNYAGLPVNYRDLFSRADAFDMLPIIPKIEGNIGEATDKNRGQRQFIFGLKLKFNSEVHAHGGGAVFDYYMNLLNPESPEHRDKINRQSFVEKILKIAFLYYFVFYSHSNPSAAGYDPESELEYDPIDAFEQNALPILKGSDEAAKRALFQSIMAGFAQINVHSKINQLKQLLKNLLNRRTPFPTQEYPLHICVRKSILEKDSRSIINNGTFFKSVLRGNPKQVLQYISVEQPNVNINSLCTLPASISMSDVYYYSTTDKQSFSMEYDIAGIHALPIVFLPIRQRICQDIYNQYFQQHKLVLFTYDHERLKNELFSESDFPQAFVYCFTPYSALQKVV